MSRTIDIDPITRIEGHLAIQIETDGRRVTDARAKGEMFRGFEVILKGRDPLDAQQITQRICGVCPISHGTASVLAQEDAYGIAPAKNGRLMRNLILGANYIQSHILHFYHLSALDFIDIAAVTGYQGSDPALLELKAWVKQELASSSIFPAAPFLPRYDSDYIKDTELNILAAKHYLEALEMRALAHKMGAVFGAKLPHATSLFPGGVTEKVTARKIAELAAMLEKLRTFIDRAYIPDVLAVAAQLPDYFRQGAGCGNFLAYGVFAESEDPRHTYFPSGVLVDGNLSPFDPRAITEDVRYSFYGSPSGLAPAKGETAPQPRKYGAYSWLKAPRYNGQAVEVGPLARLLVAYHSGRSPDVKSLLDSVLKQAGLKPASLVSVMGRHAARALECKLVADRCAAWIDQLTPDGPGIQDFAPPAEGEGMGLTEAPRGALGHWLAIKDHRIHNYQCVVPTTWNCSPRDDQGVPGPVEQALIGMPVADPQNPIEATRVVRSFDPCIACAVH